VYLSTKNTILTRYDGRFKDIFERSSRPIQEAFARADHLQSPSDRRLVASSLKWKAAMCGRARILRRLASPTTVAQGFLSPG